MDLTTATPVEIDTALAEQHAAMHALRSYPEDVYRAAGATKGYGRGPARWSMHFGDALDKARALADDESLQSWERSTAARVVKRWDEFVAKRDAINAQIAEFRAEFNRRGGWTRAFLVTDGHVHSSMACSTCNNGEYATQFTWLVEFADHTEAEVIAAAADRACTVCYPTAPVATAGPSALMTPDERTRAEQREQAAAAKVKRQAAKVAKGLTADGSEFVVSHPDVCYRTTPGVVAVREEYIGERRESFKTEQAATQWAVGVLIDGERVKGRDRMPAVHAIVAAIAAKHDQSVAEVHAMLNAKAEAKRKRDQWPAVVAVIL